MDKLTVGELRELIAPLDDDRPIVIASDEEGNRYHFVNGHNLDYYAEEDGWEVTLINLDECEICGYSKSEIRHVVEEPETFKHCFASGPAWTTEEIASLGPKAVVLWP